MSNPDSLFISCDWGSSNFRLRLVETDTLAVRAERRSGDGIIELNRRFGESPGSDRLKFFLDFLLAERAGLDPSSAPHPIVISGMASSGIGMQELEYGRLPFGGSPLELPVRRYLVAGDTTLLLVSGIRSEDDVMRGEETQAAGLLDELPDDRGTLVLPGTHSKHLRYEAGLVTAFRTYMTGELFRLLGTRSILANSVDPEVSRYVTDSAPFRDGVRRGADGGLDAGLFGVRAGELLGERDRRDSSHYFMGLLLGSELAYLAHSREPVTVAASESLAPAYHAAVDTLLPEGLFKCLEPAQLDRALLRGQAKILAQSPGG